MAGTITLLLFPFLFPASTTTPIPSEIDSNIVIRSDTTPLKIPETAYINPFQKSLEPLNSADSSPDTLSLALTSNAYDDEDLDDLAWEDDDEFADLTPEEIESIHLNRATDNSAANDTSLEGVRRCQEALNFTADYSVGADSPEEEDSKSMFVGLYLCKFGYLTSSNNISAALKDFQRFAKLPTTGVADNKTLDLMKLPRCGDSDKRTGRSKRWAHSERKWETTQLKYHISKYTNDMPRGTQRKEIKRALALWGEITPIEFVERRRYKRDVDIVLSFQYYYHRDDYTFDGTGGELAHAFLPEAGVIHFDDSEYWTSNEDRGINLYSVSAHEVGHSLGLEHTSKRGALMSPFYDNFSAEKRINADDVVSIQNLYGSRGKMLNYYCPNGLIRWDTAFADSVSGHSYAFYGEQVWKFDEDGLMDRFPKLAINVFYGLPSMKIEASVAFKTGYAFLFSGGRYWKYNATTGFMADGYPKSIATWGLDIKTRINDVIRWPRNNYVYFFTIDTYYRYNSAVGKMDDGYPQPLYLWQGVPSNMDGAMTSMDGGYIFFFLYHYYFPFNNLKARVDTDQIQEIKYSFFLCQEDVAENPDEKARFLSQTMAELNETVNDANWERFRQLEIDFTVDLSSFTQLSWSWHLLLWHLLFLTRVL